MRAVSGAFLVALAVSAVLGLCGGMAFVWARSPLDWNIFVAAFLWTLIASAGTTLGRYMGERLPRGVWRRGLWIAGATSFPLTTTYCLVAFVVMQVAGTTRRPDLGAVLPFCYAATLVLALCVGLGWVLTSPFRRQGEAHAEDL